ncbi:thioredoxin-like protein [Dentipellis sp. KUC8613]|nr:thioredoxin-like protein [Dentipellis sp. KUC8613]
MADRLRRRRLLWPLLAGCALLLFLFFSSSHELLALPPALQGLHPLSRASIAHLVRPRADEISGLLYFVTRRPDAVLSLESAGAGVGLDPAKAIDLKVYEGGDWVDWARAVKTMNAETPLVVFSKTYCPYSKRAKELLKNYDLLPAPKVVEVDLRDDGDLIKAILTRLTGRSTFPNAVLLGKSIGGSDQLSELHREGKLKALLEEAGLKVQADIKTPEGQS